MILDFIKLTFKINHSGDPYSFVFFAQRTLGLIDNSQTLSCNKHFRGHWKIPKQWGWWTWELSSFWQLPETVLFIASAEETTVNLHSTVNIHAAAIQGQSQSCLSMWDSHIYPPWHHKFVVRKQLIVLWCCHWKLISNLKFESVFLINNKNKYKLNRNHNQGML